LQLRARNAQVIKDGFSRGRPRATQSQREHLIRLNKRRGASVKDAGGGGPCIPLLIRRVAITACSALTLLAAVASQNALAQSSRPIRNIQVDVAPLRANVGDPTASWVQQGLSNQLAQTLAGRMTTQGGTLVGRIDYVVLGPIKDSSA
jgi:hypothetical protein